jgi:stalled ribosome rescue protein Dom34
VELILSAGRAVLLLQMVNKARVFKTGRKVLMVSCRVHNVAQRKRWVALVESVQSGGGQVFIFSSRHESGKQLMAISGIAAILRFPMPDLEDQDPAELLAALEIG